MSNEKPIFRCVKSKSSGKNEWVKPEPSIPVAELKSWCAENSLVSDKGNDYVLCDELLARFCKEGE